MKLNSIVTLKKGIDSHYVITHICATHVVINTLIYPSNTPPFISKLQRKILKSDLINYKVIGSHKDE